MTNGYLSSLYVTKTIFPPKRSREMGNACRDEGTKIYSEETLKLRPIGSHAKLFSICVLC